MHKPLSLVLAVGLLAACAPDPIATPPIDPERHAAYRAEAEERRRLRDLEAERLAHLAHLAVLPGRTAARIVDLGDGVLVTLAADGLFEAPRRGARSDRLSAEGLETVAAVAGSLAARPGARVAVISHVERGPDPRRDKIDSDRRAVAVKGALISRGIDACRIGVIGRGAMEPVGRRGTLRDEQFDARVEIVIVPLRDGAC